MSLSLFSNKKSVTLVWNIGSIPYYPGLINGGSELIAIPKNEMTWDITPINTTDPDQGYLISFSGQYLTVEAQQPGISGLTCSPDRRFGVPLIPVQVDSNTFYLQAVGLPDMILTTDPKHPVVQFLPLQPDTGSTLYQKFTIDQHFNEDDRQYFWICDASGNNAFEAAPMPGLPVISNSVSNKDAQLFRMDQVGSGAAFHVVCKLNGCLLDAGLSASAAGQPLITNEPAIPEQAAQQWLLMDDSGYLTSGLNNYVASWQPGAGSYIVADVKKSPADANQAWAPMAYFSAPPLYENQFFNLEPDAVFLIRNLDSDDVLSWQADTNYTLVMQTALDASSPYLVLQQWQYKEGFLWNVGSQLPLSVDAQNNLLLAQPSDPQLPRQSWRITYDGYILNAEQTDQVADLITGTKTPLMNPYDPSGMAYQTWALDLFDTDSGADRKMAPASMATAVPPLRNNPNGNSPLGETTVLSLRVKITMSNDLFAGTTDDIYVAFDSSEENWQLLSHRPDRGQTDEVLIDMGTVFSGRPVKFKDLTVLYLGFDDNSPGVFTNKGEVESIILTATGSDNLTYVNYTFQNINTYIDPHYRSWLHWNRPVSWTGYISLANWTDANFITTPIDLLDIWGEGYINDNGLITGFAVAKNLNKAGQTISNGPNRGNPIPNLVPVDDYDWPIFPIEDNLASYITLMGAPITEGTAREMYRVLNKTNGVVMLYAPDDSHRSVWEANMGNLVYKPDDPLNSPFNIVTLRPVFIYGFPNVTDRDEL